MRELGPRMLRIRQLRILHCPRARRSLNKPCHQRAMSEAFRLPGDGARRTATAIAIGDAQRIVVRSQSHRGGSLSTRNGPTVAARQTPRDHKPKLH